MADETKKAEMVCKWCGKPIQVASGGWIHSNGYTHCSRNCAYSATPASASRTQPEQLPERPTREKRHGFYVASRASVPERGAMWRSLRQSGVQINSSWIDEDGEGQTNDFSELWLRIQREVESSEALILYAESNDFPLKGALIEVGMAISAGVPVRVVLPGVKLEPRSNRPVGSWLAHPGVIVVDNIRAALESHD